MDGLLEAAGKIATPNTPIETRYQDLPDLETWNSVLLYGTKQHGYDDISVIL